MGFYLFILLIFYHFLSISFFEPDLFPAPFVYRKKQNAFERMFFLPNQTIQTIVIGNSYSKAYLLLSLSVTPEMLLDMLSFPIARIPQLYSVVARDNAIGCIVFVPCDV